MAFCQGEIDCAVITKCDHVHCEHGHGHDVTPADKPSWVMAFGRRLAAAGLFRFAGWWGAFAGFFAMNSVCPICGSSTCPVGIGTTGVLAALFAVVKQWGGKCVEQIRMIIGSGTGSRATEQHVHSEPEDTVCRIEKG